MLKRTREILSECDRVWPLASRWVDSLDRAYNQPHQAPLMSEGSMTDSKDPVPQAWLKRSNSTPPSEHGKVAAAANDNSQAAKVASPIDAVMTAYVASHPDTDILQQQSLPFYGQAEPSFSAVGMQHVPPSHTAAIPFSAQAHLPNSLMTQPSAGHIYVPSHQPTDDVALMMASPFQPSPTTPHATAPPQHGYMLNQQGPGGIYQQTDPGNDGFEDELQVYMGGKESRFMPTNWNGPF